MKISFKQLDRLWKTHRMGAFLITLQKILMMTLRKMSTVTTMKARMIAIKIGKNNSDDNNKGDGVNNNSGNVNENKLNFDSPLIK